MAAPQPGAGRWLRLRGCTFSECCKTCAASADSMELALRRQHAAAGGRDGSKEAPRRMTLTIAGDIKGLETLAGHAGPSATWNCIMCEAKLNETYKAGVPHLRVLPDEWKSMDTRATEIINPPPRGGTHEMAEHARQYKAAAAAPNAPKDLSSAVFKSCVQEPLFRSTDLEEHVSRTPLHITLGLGTNYLKAVEARCAERDSEWALNVADEQLIASWNDAKAKVFELTEEHDAIAEGVRSTEAGMLVILQKDPRAARQGRTDADREDGRDLWVLKYRAYKEQLVKQKKEAAEAQRQLDAATKEEACIRESMLKLTTEGAGPFGKRFKELLVTLEISMKKYFGGTYIGPDLQKIFGNLEHIRMLCDVLKAGDFECPDGIARNLGKDEEADELYSCLRPFGQLHQLYNRCEPLCEHEIATFSALRDEHAIAFARVFPTTVPTLKMHILCMHMEELLERHASIGMDTEQGIECYHPEVTYVFNKFRALDRRPEAQLRAVAKQVAARGAGARDVGESSDLREAKVAKAERQRMVVKIEKSC